MLFHWVEEMQQSLLLTLLTRKQKRNLAVLSNLLLVRQDDICLYEREVVS